MQLWTPDWALAAALLATGAAFDVVRHRIPNAIPVATAAAGIAARALGGGAAAALSSFAALALVFAVLLLPWRLRALGGGDLKLAAAAAAWVGLGRLGEYAVASGLALGGLAAVSYLASTRAVRREIRTNLALASRHVWAPVEIAGGAGRVPVAAGAAFAAGALYALTFGG